MLLAGIHALQPHQIRLLALDDVDLGVGALGGPPATTAVTTSWRSP